MPVRRKKAEIQIGVGRTTGGGVYARSLETIRSAIRMAAYEPGVLLPPERELAERHGISRRTIRKVLATLAAEGLVELRPRVGYAIAAGSGRALVADSAPVGFIHRDFSSLACSHRYITVLESLLGSSGHLLMLGASGRDAERENAWIRRFRQNRVGALVIAPATRGGQSTELESWIRDRLPVVLYGHPGPWRLGADLAAQCDQVDIDNRGGVQQVVGYLVSLGHRAIGFLTDQALGSTERLPAFLAALQAAGIVADPKCQIGGLPEGKEGGREAFRRLREAGALPTAVFCSQNDIALGFMDALGEAGLRCPEDVSVVGFGDQAADGPGALMRLTTAEYNSDSAAVETLRLLQRQFAGDREHPEIVKLPVQLTIRASAACPRQEGGCA